MQQLIDMGRSRAMVEEGTWEQTVKAGRRRLPIFFALSIYARDRYRGVRL